MSLMGDKIKIEIFGASHSDAIGMTLTGFPAGEQIDFDELCRFMLRRAPGRDATSTPRKEGDVPEFLCGVLDGVTTGEPITAIIRNTNQHSKDYEKLRYTPRPSHADYAAYLKYSGNNDIRGGGAFSGRMTAPLCIGGGIAKQYLYKHFGIEIGAHALMIGGVYDEAFDAVNPKDVCGAGKKDFPTVSDASGEEMKRVILDAKADGDSVGGIIECAVTGIFPEIGGPLFDGVESKLSAALFGIPAVKGVEFGSGFGCAAMRGSENNDEFEYKNGKVVTKTNNSGGIQGGITNGMPIIFRVAVKPTPSIGKPQNTVNLKTKENVILEIGGRHDPCIVARAVPVVEAVAALALLDMMENE